LGKLLKQCTTRGERSLSIAKLFRPVHPATSTAYCRASRRRVLRPCTEGQGSGPSCRLWPCRTSLLIASQLPVLDLLYRGLKDRDQAPLVRVQEATGRGSRESLVCYHVVGLARYGRKCLTQAEATIGGEVSKEGVAGSAISSAGPESWPLAPALTPHILQVFRPSSKKRLLIRGPQWSLYVSNRRLSRKG
jgi:hypothetical protein